MTGRVRDMILDPDADGRAHRRHHRGRLLRHADLRPGALRRTSSAGRVTVEDALIVATSPHDFKLLLDAQGRRGTTMADVPDDADAAAPPPAAPPEPDDEPPRPEALPAPGSRATRGGHPQPPRAVCERSRPTPSACFSW